MSLAELPHDVLCEVFKTLAVIDPISSLSPYGWICQATHVCRAWENAALDQAELWADVVCASESASVLIERAHSAPVVFIGINPRYSPQLTEHQLDLAVQYIENVRVLVHPVLHLPLSSIFDGRTLPQLEFLHVSQIQPSSVPVMPLLRTLALRFCCLPIHAPQLRSLGLKFDRERASRAAALVLDILSQTPLLEELRISDLLYISGTKPEAVPKAYLVRLRILRILERVLWQRLLA